MSYKLDNCGMGMLLSRYQMALTPDIIAIVYVKTVLHKY